MRILVWVSLLVLPVFPGFPQPLRGLKTLLDLEPSKVSPRVSEGDLVELKDGRICFVYTRFTGGAADNAEADIVMRTSRDGGETWSDERVLVKNEGKENVMSVSILRLPSGELLLFYLVKNGWDDLYQAVRRSADEFETLSAPVVTTPGGGYNVVNNDRVVRLSTGRLVVPVALHLCPDGTRATWSSRGIPRIFYSDDDGRTWHPDRTDTDHPPLDDVTLQEPGVVELKDGRLLMFMRTDGGVQYRSFSCDGGLTWSRPEPGNLYSPMSPASIERIPWTGDLLCVWNDHSGWHRFPPKKRSPLCVALSKDDGKTWSPSRVIEADPDGWYCYTSISFIGDRVFLSYCAGDRVVGGLNRLRVTSISRAWLYPEP